MIFSRILRSRKNLKTRSQRFAYAAKPVSKTKISAPSNPSTANLVRKQTVLANAGNIWSMRPQNTPQNRELRSPDLTGFALDKLYGYVLPILGPVDKRRLLLVESVLPWWTDPQAAKFAQGCRLVGGVQIGSAIVLKNFHNGNLHALCWVLLPMNALVHKPLKPKLAPPAKKHTLARRFFSRT